MTREISREVTVTDLDFDEFKELKSTEFGLGYACDDLGGTDDVTPENIVVRINLNDEYKLILPAALYVGLLEHMAEVLEELGGLARQIESGDTPKPTDAVEIMTRTSGTRH